MYKIQFTDTKDMSIASVVTDDPEFYLFNPRYNVVYCDLVEEVDDRVVEEA